MMSNDVSERLLQFGVDIDASRLRYHDKWVLVTKEFTFDAAHHLYDYEGNCSHLHGHTYRLQVSVRGPLDDHGMVMDFADLKRAVQQSVLEKVDHHYLNAVLPTMNTTAENMVVWIFEQISSFLHDANQQAVVERIILWETPTSSVEMTRGAMGW